MQKIKLTARYVEFLEWWAGAPEPYLESDERSVMCVWKSDGFASEDPHVTDKRRDKCDKRQQSKSDAQPWEWRAGWAAAHFIRKYSSETSNNLCDKC